MVAATSKLQQSKNVALANGNILADYLISTAFDIIQLAKQKSTFKK